MTEFYQKYYDFYIKIEDDLSAKSKYFREFGKLSEQTGKIELNQELKNDINELENASRAPPKPSTPKRIRKVGERVFEALFTDDIGKDFRNAYDETAEKNLGLRILLDIVPKYTDFPWELARYKKRFLATDVRTPFLRISPGETQAVNLPEGKMPRVLSILSKANPKTLLASGLALSQTVLLADIIPPSGE